MGGWESESDERVLAAAARDPLAFATFYRRYERSMLAFFVRRTADPELAADLTAAVFAAALHACARYRPVEALAAAGAIRPAPTTSVSAARALRIIHDPL